MAQRSARAFTATLIYGLLITTVSIPAHAIETESEIQLVPLWREGDAIDYEIVKTRRKQENGRETLNTTSRTDLSVKVLAASDDGYHLSWTLGETSLDDPVQAQNPLVRQVAGLMKGFSLLFNVDEVARLQGVTNWQELQAKTSEAIAAITAELRRAGIPAKQIDLIRQQVEGLFATKERTEQYCLKEPRMFLLPLGRSYSLASSIEYEDRVPNPFGGEPFPTVGVFSLRQYDEQTNVAQVLWQQTFDPEASQRILAATMKAMTAKLGKPAEEFEPLKTFSIEDRAEFSIDASTGWIIRMQYTHTVKTDTSSQEDTVIIRQRESEGSPQES